MEEGTDMAPDFSVNLEYVLWLWRYELMSAAAVAVVVAIATYWKVRRRPILTARSVHYELQKVQVAPASSNSECNYGVVNP
jgi:hypothetical protein